MSIIDLNGARARRWKRRPVEAPRRRAGRVPMLAIWGAVLIAIWVVTADRTVPQAPAVQGIIGVVDGDTVRIDGTVFRLAGFDTPETGANARCAGERRLAAAATDRMRMLATRPDAVLRPVSCHCRHGTEGTAACNYGRRCGALTVAGRDAGAIMIEEGLARPYVCGSGGCPQRQSWCG